MSRIKVLGPAVLKTAGLMMFVYVLFKIDQARYQRITAEYEAKIQAARQAPSAPPPIPYAAD